MVGLPRSGTTLLTSILSQNPKIYCRNNSLLVQLMYDLNESFNTKYALTVMQESGTTDIQSYVMSNIPNLLYHNIKNDIIVDHSRKSIHPENFELIKKYVEPKPKFVILYRKLEEIIASFANIAPNLEIKNFYLNAIYDDKSLLMDPFHSAIKGIREIKDLECIFINYDDILKDTNKVLDLFYNFYELDRFDHDLNNIKQSQHYIKDADVAVYNTPGLHDVRPTINKREYSVELSDDIIERCKFLNFVMEEAIENYKYK